MGSNMIKALLVTDLAILGANAAPAAAQMQHDAMGPMQGGMEPAT